LAIDDDNGHYFPGMYRGLVVNNQDPLNSQRVQIRILGLHTSNKNGNDGDYIPDNNLPWAEQAGMFLDGTYIPQKDAWVWLFFENNNHNQPVYFAKCRKANDTSPEIDNIDMNKLGQPRTEETTEINHGNMIIKSANTIHGKKIEIRNKENNAFLKLDTFNGKSRCIISADLLEFDGEMSAGKGTKGYPVLSETKSTLIAMGGVRLRTGNSGVA
jgi:hypothetical protein